MSNPTTTVYGSLPAPTTNTATTSPWVNSDHRSVNR